MNLGGITTLVVVGGLLLVLFCVVQAEISYQRIKRHLEQIEQAEDGPPGPGQRAGR